MARILGEESPADPKVRTLVDSYRLLRGVFPSNLWTLHKLCEKDLVFGAVLEQYGPSNGLFLFVLGANANAKFVLLECDAYRTKEAAFLRLNRSGASG